MLNKCGNNVTKHLENYGLKTMSTTATDLDLLFQVVVQALLFPLGKLIDVVFQLV